MATEDAASVTRSPAGTPAFLRSHPALQVEWLQLVNLLSRWREEGARAAVFAFCSVLVAGLLLALASLHASELIGTLAGYRILVAAVAAMYAWMTVSRRRRHLEEAQSQSWLVATPISSSSLRLSLAIRTFLPIVLSLLAAVLLFAAFALLSNATGVARVTAAFTAGLFIGSAAGWWIGGRGAKQPGALSSRYVPRPRIRIPNDQLLSMRPDASALSRWPVAQVLSWSRPENSRYVLIIALLAVQGGSSALAGLSVVAMYFIASYLGALFSAMTTVARSAASWLRSTPMTLGDFVWSLSRRALAHQLAGTTLAVILMSLLGAPLAIALEIAALWLALVISISGCALVDHYRGRSPALKIAASVATLVTIAAVLHLRAGTRA